MEAPAAERNLTLFFCILATTFLYFFDSSLLASFPSGFMFDMMLLFSSLRMPFSDPQEERARSKSRSSSICCLSLSLEVAGKARLESADSCLLEDLFLVKGISRSIS